MLDDTRRETISGSVPVNSLLQKNGGESTPSDRPLLFFSCRSRREVAQQDLLLVHGGSFEHCKGEFCLKLFSFVNSPTKCWNKKIQALATDVQNEIMAKCSRRIVCFYVYLRLRSTNERIAPNISASAGICYDHPRKERTKPQDSAPSNENHLLSTKTCCARAFPS